MMKKITFGFLMLVLAVASKAYGMDAMEYFNLGLKNRMTNQKIEYYTRALELQPEFADAYEKRGWLYYFIGKYDKVVQDFQTYIELAPAKAEAFRMVGMGYLKSGIYPAAIDYFTRAIEIDAGLTSAYSYRAEAYRLNNDFQNAVLDVNRAIEIWGDPIVMSDAYRTRAKIYWELGRNQEAYADNKQAMSIDPRVPRLWGRYPPLEYMRSMGLIILIGISFVTIFGLKFRPPDKEE